MRNMRVRNWVVAGLEDAREIATVFLEQKIVQRGKVILIVHHEFGDVDLAAALVSLQQAGGSMHGRRASL
jgi:hypothetical protein